MDEGDLSDSIEQCFRIVQYDASAQHYYKTHGINPTDLHTNFLNNSPYYELRSKTMSNQFTVTTSLNANQVGEEHKPIAAEYAQQAFGLANDVVEARMVLMTKHADGKTNFTSVDFDRSRDVQLNVRSRNLHQDLYTRLSASFDSMNSNIARIAEASEKQNEQNS